MVLTLLPDPPPLLYPSVRGWIITQLAEWDTETIAEFDAEDLYEWSTSIHTKGLTGYDTISDELLLDQYVHDAHYRIHGYSSSDETDIPPGLSVIEYRGDLEITDVAAFVEHLNVIVAEEVLKSAGS